MEKFIIYFFLQIKGFGKGFILFIWFWVAFFKASKINFKTAN